MRKLMHSYLIVENHNFMQKNKDLVKAFEENSRKFFEIEIIPQASKDPFRVDSLKNFNELDKWLMMNEGRPQSMNWIYLMPKNK